MAPPRDWELAVRMNRVKLVGMFRRMLSVTVLMGSLAVAAAVAQDNRAQAGSVADPAKSSFEVASIKPWDGTGFGIAPLSYIKLAFGVPVNSAGLVIGPDWINNTRYVIETKPPDSVRDAMKTMTAEQRDKINQQMQQSLLADRFKMKAHFETRQMPEYELVVAKGGEKMKENPDRTHSGYTWSATGIIGTSVPVPALTNALMATSDIGGRVVIDKTGLTGRYDISLKWASISSTSPGAGDPDSVSLFTAIQEQLGLKLVPTKGPVQVLVIDHIERPSAN